jgi:8-oxo-dGTP diphosphatase
MVGVLGFLKIITVVAAIIKDIDKYLCLQRGYNKYPYISYKYEFPGGKIEAGETEIDALKREILEELNIEVEVQDKFLIVEHNYPDFKLIMHSYICKKLTNDMVLKEHIDSKWLNHNELSDLDWAGADIPIVNKLIL